jgi:hypothetical protein
LLTVLTAAAACRDSLSPRQVAVPTDPSKMIVDGAHNGGNLNVFFLPPMVANPVGQTGYGAPFQPGLPVEIKLICTTKATNSGCPNFDFPPSVVKGSQTDEQYMVNWDTRSPGADSGDVYQAQVWVGSEEIAYADIVLTGNGKNPKNAATQNDILLPDGRTLPIKVRIQQGWNCQNQNSCVTQVVSATATTPTLVKTNDGRAAALFPPGTFSTDVIVTIEDVTASLKAGETCKNPTGPVLTSMVASPQCFKFTTDPKVTFQQPVTVATCVDVEPVRESTDPLFHTEQLIKYDVGEQTTFLRNATPPITCPPETPSIGSRSSNSLKELALAAISRVGHFFVPKSAYAFHLGVGGTIDLGGGFSYITAGFPISESLLSGDGQTGTVGTPLAQQFKVLITSQHFNSVPVPNEPVQCKVTAGGGNLGNGITLDTVFTGPDGIAACPILTLGPTAVPNTVTATALNIDDGVTASEDLGRGPFSVTLHGVVTFNATATAGTLGFVSVTTTDGQTPFDNSSLSIDGPVVDFIATIQNPGSAIGSSDVPVILQNWVQQGKTRRAAGGTDLTCATQGVLPSGSCVQNWGASANDVQSSGTGVLSAGSATLILELWQGSVGDGTLLATKSIPITLIGVSQVPGAIQGTVLDAEGAVIPGVTVTAVLGDGAPHSVETNADGFYQITQLLAGSYSVAISAGGFTAPPQQATVTPGGTITVNFSPTRNP